MSRKGIYAREDCDWERLFLRNPDYSKVFEERSQYFKFTVASYRDAYQNNTFWYSFGGAPLRRKHLLELDEGKKRPPLSGQSSHPVLYVLNTT